MENFDTFINALKDALADEASDVKKYTDMSEEACANPELKKYAPILRDISHEESIHHKHIMSILHDLGEDVCEHPEIEIPETPSDAEGDELDE